MAYIYNEIVLRSELNFNSNDFETKTIKEIQIYLTALYLWKKRQKEVSEQEN